MTPDALVYLKTARGFRGGAMQLRFPVLPPAAPETAKDIEIGLKSDWLENRLRVNLAAYRTKYANKQESIIITDSSGTLRTVIQNAATATIHGFEAELTAVPVQGLTLNANTSYLKGKYNKFPGALPVVNGAPAVDASGERFSFPPWQVNLSARYAFGVGPGELGLSANWSWVDGARPPPRLINPLIPKDLLDKLVGAANGGAYANGFADLGLLSLRADYDIKDMGLNVSLFVTNALNKKYQVASIDPSFIGNLSGITGEPRMWGVTIRKGFGGE